MPTQIVIDVGGEQFSAHLSESRAPETVQRILEALPLRAAARTWGAEIYFEIPVEAGEENAVAAVQKGDLAYWPQGRCFCIFYGKTPMSSSEDVIVPASPVNVVGAIDDYEALRDHGAGEEVAIRLAG